jgi:hypothetical protein
MFVYNDTGFLLAIAIVDGVLFSVRPLEDLERKRIPRGENVLHLRYNESHLEKPILRKYIIDGRVTDDPMPKPAFLAIWKSNCSNAGYFELPMIHATRLGLGIKVEDEYVSALPIQSSPHSTFLC